MQTDREKYERILCELGSGHCTILPLVPIGDVDEEPLTSDKIAREYYTDGAGDA